uniref:Uncharacterized protein n=1 Tax=Tanacetum cinerariifolium TaxID=118510 RepID=A0A6L2JC96_TANCI|nr:hypothetical protein [Tanacetum cinerariifolium]
MKGNEKNNETLIALTPILSVEDKRYEVVSSGWSFISAVPGQMTYPVESLALDSARSYVMQGAPFTQGMIFSIPICGNISLEGFLLPILLLVVIIVTVVIVVVILVVVIVAIVGVVIVVTIIGVVVVIGVFAIIKLSFVIIITFPSILLGNPSMKTSISFSEFGTIVGHKVANSWNLLIPDDLVGLLYSNRFGIRIPPGQGILGVSLGLVVLSVFAMLAACASRAAETLSATSFLIDGHEDNGMRDPIEGLVSLVDLTGNEDPIDEDGDTGVSDLEVLVSLGEILAGGRKSRESNIGDSDNTRDGGKIVYGAIGACSRGIGKKDSEAKKSLVKSSKKLKEVFLGEAGK